MIAERMRLPDAADPGPRAALRMMFPASEEAVRAALRHWRRAVAGMGEVEDLMDRSEIVLAEVLNNIAEHGRVDAATGWIGLRCDPGPLGLRFVVTDRGRPLPPALLTPLADGPTLPQDLDLPDLPEGGFGWQMIRLLTRELTCQHEAQGNRLSFLIPRHAPGG
jgi:serine/threonine-protein kinase RsbW